MQYEQQQKFLDAWQEMSQKQGYDTQINFRADDETIQLLNALEAHFRGQGYKIGRSAIVRVLIAQSLAIIVKSAPELETVSLPDLQRQP